MEVIEQMQVLDSFSILVDTREQKTKASEARYKAFGCPYAKATLDYGDYSFNCLVPSNKPLYDTTKRVKPCVVVERKESLDELAMCLGTQRKRFEKEMERIKSNQATIYLLVENATWENLMNGRYRSKFHPNAFLGTLIQWSARYNLKIIFCKAESSGKLIKEILFRELRERIERGEFDGVHQSG